MRSPARFLESSDPLRPAEPPAALPFDSDVVVILAALLCSLICVVGLALVARCACLRRAAASSSSSSSSPYPAPPSKGLKKRAVEALPTLSFDSSASASTGDGAADPEAAGGVKLVDCAICLAEFADGDVVCVLPQCGHGFHAECVHTWLRSHSSCPSCRRVLVIPALPRCRECGASSAASSAAKAAVGRGSSTFLP